LSIIKHLLIGSPLSTHLLQEKRLNKIRALAAFSPDALSSIAYANQEIFLGLVVAGSAGLSLSWPIGLAITGLLVLVAFSYYQTIQGYPTGGGSYVVARRNLGTLPGVIAASALLIGYILTAAVSLTAGVAAIASAFPALWAHRIILALLFLLLITLLNLRGLRETGTLMAIPVYFFLFSYLSMLVYGVVRAFIEGPGDLSSTFPITTQTVNTVLVLRTFAAGCTALTGIEAISNGIPAFHPPEAPNARKTLAVMAILMGILFVGSIGLTQFMAVAPGAQETVLSALAHRLLGSGFAYYMIQASTMLILVVAANTSFAGFPRLAAILAADNFLPHQMTNLGDRLVFNNGILTLSFVTGILIIVFGGDTHALIPLFAVGVFLAFTLSQAGMVAHWWRVRGKLWIFKSFVNGLGAIATFVAVIIIAGSKFVEGAWITILLIPLLIFILYNIRAHYRGVAQQLSMDSVSLKEQIHLQPRLVIPISGVHRGVIDAVNFACSISQDVTAVYIELEDGAGDRIHQRWLQCWPNLPLAIVPSPYRSIINPLLNYLDEADRQRADGQFAVLVLPEFVPAHWWQGLLHNQTAWLIKAALLYRRRHQGFQRVIIDVPFHLQR
jgi:amino acid transporter